MNKGFKLIFRFYLASLTSTYVQEISWYPCLRKKDGDLYDALGDTHITSRTISFCWVEFRVIPRVLLICCVGMRARLHII